MAKTFLMMTSLAVAYASQVDVTPVQKVITLLTGMIEKGKKEKHDEEVQFAAFKEFCDAEINQKEVAIVEETENIDHFTADIRKERAVAAKLKKDIGSLDADISTWQGDMHAATKVRELEKADYDKLYNDYSESVDALMAAIASLKKGASAVKERTGGLVQIAALSNLDLMPAPAKKAIDAFLQQGFQEPDLELLAVGAPEANSYEFQSSGIIQMLEKLLDKFIEERRVIQKTEMNSRDAYELLMKDLQMSVETATEQRANKASNRAKQLEKKAEDKTDREDEKVMKVEDSQYKKDVEATCKQKTSDFESRQQLRADELVALEKAVEIISSRSLAGNANKHLPAMLQKKVPAFPQLRSNTQSAGWNQVATYLQERALKLNSRVLATIAEHAAAGPFTKVKKMISDLLARLMEQANEEAEHKGWCDTELATNEQTRKEKTDAVETLHAEIDELQASIAKLTEDVGELSHDVADLDAAMAKQTKLRMEEKAKNSQTIADAREAQEAVDQALSVLREFYEKAGEATTLVQEQPEIFGDTPYQGMQSESDGVLGMLEVIHTDFARLESATKVAEVSAQKEYDDFVTDAKNDKLSKSSESSHKDTKKTDAMNALATKKHDLAGTQKELEASLIYYDKLKPSCVDSGASYDDRVARRKEEIESLQEALRILSGEELA